MFVGSDLVLVLSIGDCQSELLMKFVKVYYRVMSAGEDKVFFRVDREVWVVTFIGKEG